MKTETMIEECFILAHRINKLGGCVFVEDSGHVNGIGITIAQSKDEYSNKLHGVNGWYDKSDNYGRRIVTSEYGGTIEEMHAILTDLYNTLKGETE